MNADPLTINKVFSSGGDVQYVLPHFQREYAWEKKHWQTLFDDVMELYEANPESNPEHFIGALVVIQDGDSRGTMFQFTLVDGQQRLITISLLLCALKYTLHPDSRLRGTIEKLLVNPDEEGILRHKVKPTQKYNDRQAYSAIIDGELNPRFDSRIVKAWKYFRTRLSRLIDEIDETRFFDCIVNHMQVVFIKLNRSEQPYRIFESLNAKGKRLTEADLVRNYIAMKLPPDRQEQVFYEYWAKIDDMLREQRTVARMGELSSFLRHYLAKTYGVLPKTNQVYARFRDHMERNFAETEKFIDELKRLHLFARFYDKLLRPDNETDSRIQRGIRRLNTIVESVCYPLLLFLYESHTEGKISELEFVKALEIIENYSVRRFLAGERTNSLNNIFASLPRELDIANFVPSLTEQLSDRGYPRNERVRQNMRLRFRYAKGSRDRLVLVLQSIDRHLAKGTDGYPVLNDDATIEHIMPQTLDDSWREHIGIDCEEVHRDYLDALGNVTLITQEWNTELSNGSFATKQAKLANHALRINSGYFSKDVQRWNKDAIISRTEWLTELAVAVWHPLRGFSPPRSDIDNSKPASLVIELNKHTVNNWREVLITTVELLMDRFPVFDVVSKRFDQFISHTNSGFTRSHELPNGYWLNISHSATRIYNFCKQFALAAGLDNHDWHVDYE